jgi:hypothetical protein
MPDLFRMASNRNPACLQLLLDHDRNHVHWLHDSDTDTAQQRADAAARPSDSSIASHQLPDRLQFLMEELDDGASAEVWISVPAAQKLSE